ncbi:MAG: Gldg family protein [Anaerolineae bacterium]|nr:Gldg family protein [Anaerolineae bacterium]
MFSQSYLQFHLLLQSTRQLTFGMANYKSKLVLKLIVFITILILINALCFNNNSKFDLTETRSYSLSPHTIKVLQELSQPVKILCFFRSGDARQAKAKIYLDQFETRSSLISSEFHDPDLEPDLWYKHALKDYGLLFMAGNQTYEVHHIDEMHLTHGLLAVTRPQSEPAAPMLSEPAAELPFTEMSLNFLAIVFVFFVSVLLIPFTFVTLSLLVWWQQR